MMDFDLAVNKLSRSHSRQVRRNRGKRNHGSSLLVTNGGSSSTGGRSNGGLALSEKARREAEARERRNEERRRKERVEKNKLRRVRAYVSKCERESGTVRISADAKANANADSSDLFRPTSVHGDGDKITLPVSVLETLMKDQNDDFNNSNNEGSPFEFRVGIPNPDYEFPASPKLVKMMERVRTEDDDDDDDSNSDDSDTDDDDDDDDDFDSFAAWTDELSYKYLVHTHCTVVEFTQEEGHVGIPSAVAGRLLADGRVSATRTVDPAGKGTEEPTPSSSSTTPGHLAWGAFDVPASKVEITKVTLPKGKGCTLTPTKESLRNGFANLKDVKAVLEQSLIRTRATLSVNDTVHCWHRGTKFELVVSSLTPSDRAAVSCINTDIEVDIGPAVDDDDDEKMTDVAANYNDDEEMTDVAANDNDDGKTTNVVEDKTATAGRRIGTSVSDSLPKQQQQQQHKLRFKPLPPEPPAERNVDVCDVQIRGDGKTGRRRFDLSNDAVGHLFAFAADVCFAGSTSPPPNFRLVTRFPRRVLESGGGDDDRSLKEAGVEEGRIMFMVESSPSV